MIRVVTSGCFDLLNIGHARFLQCARSHGDALIVLLESDESARASRGALPVRSSARRAEMLLATRWVEHVLTYHESTPAGVLSAIVDDSQRRGDVIVYAATRAAHRLAPPEASVLRSVDRVVLLPSHADESSVCELREIRSRA